MFILNITTDDPIRVIRKLDEKPSQLLTITCPPQGKKYRLVYALYQEL